MEPTLFLMLITEILQDVGSGKMLTIYLYLTLQEGNFSKDKD